MLRRRWQQVLRWCGYTGRAKMYYTAAKGLERDRMGRYLRDTGLEAALKAVDPIVLNWNWPSLTRRSYAFVSTRAGFGDQEVRRICGLPVKVDPAMPPGEFELRDERGEMTVRGKLPDVGTAAGIA